MQIAPGKVRKANYVDLIKKKFIFSKEKKTFKQFPYPVNETIKHYQKYRRYQYKN